MSKKIMEGKKNMRDVPENMIVGIALIYVNMNVYQTRLIIAGMNCDARQEKYRIINWRFEGGLRGCDFSATSKRPVTIRIIISKAFNYRF
jgi:hypothetical protein